MTAPESAVYTLCSTALIWQKSHYRVSLIGLWGWMGGFKRWINDLFLMIYS